MQVQIFLEAGIPPAEVAELGELAAAKGIHTLWASSFPARREPFMCLSALAAKQLDLNLGVVPVSPYEMHPLKIAESLLTLNELSAGHGTITIGGMGHSVMRVTGLESARRVTAVRECIEIVRAAATGEAVNYQGKLYSLMNYQADYAKSVSPPVLYVGANGPAMLKMAGEVADGVMLSDMPLSRMPDVRERLQAGRHSADRGDQPFRIANFFAWHVKEDQAAAHAEARMELIWRGLLLPSHTAPFLGDEAAAFVDANRDAFLQAFLTRNPVIEGIPEAIVDSLVDNLTFTGGPDDLDRIAADLQKFATAGLDEVTLKIHGDARVAIELIGERLIPALRT